jgi:hypothetical protein
MRRLTFLLGVGAMSLAFASPASASTTVAVQMTFTEPIIPMVHRGDCEVFNNEAGFCGQGAVIPFGQATETIEFGACGATCDFRTINLAEGSIFIEETFSDPDCPGACQPNRAEPGSGTLTDVIVGGTGIFEGATGTLTGTVRAAGPQSQIKLSGEITLQDP